jgi:hypothetical protein
MLGVTHEFSGVTRTLICMGTVFAGKGRGMAEVTQGLPLSRPMEGEEEYEVETVLVS